jgi:hypothetical protein
MVANRFFKDSKWRYELGKAYERLSRRTILTQNRLIQNAMLLKVCGRFHLQSTKGNEPGPVTLSWQSSIPKIPAANHTL